MQPSHMLVSGLAMLAGLGCKPEAAAPPPRGEPRSVSEPPLASSAASCDGSELPFDVESEGPFASLMAMCDHALHRSGNDASRICHEDIGAVSLARPRLAPASAIRDARVVAYDRGGDYIFCNLALETAMGWTVFWGPVCDNSMNDDAYAFTVHELTQAPHGEGSLLLARFTVTESIHDLADGYAKKGSFLTICGVPPGSEAPTCSTIPEALSGDRHLIDFAPALRDGAVVFSGPKTRDHLPWVVFTNFLDSQTLLERLDPPRRFCLPTFR
jgi:hypothetical protein